MQGCKKKLRQAKKNLKNVLFSYSQFTRITTIDQRRQYKTEFDNDYAEYMRLHADTERISKRFTQLEERLRSEEHNDQRYKVYTNCAPDAINLKLESNGKVSRRIGHNIIISFQFRTKL